MIVKNREEKKRIARNILESLTDWFGVPEAREKYISEAAEQEMVVQKEFEIIPDLWSEEDPCQIYVMYIGDVSL